MIKLERLRHGYVEPVSQTNLYVDSWKRCCLGPHEDGFALTPNQTAQAELTTWSLLWRPGTVSFHPTATSRSSWATDDLIAI
eukprot:2540634-Amphidinium_carterae.1